MNTIKPNATLVFASNNAHKKAEVQAIAGSGLRLISPAELGLLEELPESSATLAENALQKAAFVFERFPELEVFSEDSGLFVDCLNGDPGVHTARFAGAGATDQQNIQLLLERMKGHSNRKAAFKTVICLMSKEGQHFFEGECPGIIASALSGEGGFGYDPVFHPLKGDEMEPRSFAAIPSEEKNRLSHRGKALRKMLAYLHSQGKM